MTRTSKIQIQLLSIQTLQSQLQKQQAATIPIGVNPDHSTDHHAAISQETEAPAPITAIM